MKLRDYQLQTIKDTYRFFRLGLKSVLIYAPTGAGKTVIASRMIADAVGRGRRVLFLVHRTKLINQTATTLKNVYGIDCGVIWANVPPNPDAPVQIAMVQTIQNRDLPPDIRHLRKMLTLFSNWLSICDRQLQTLTCLNAKIRF